MAQSARERAFELIWQLCYPEGQIRLPLGVAGRPIVGASVWTIVEEEARDDKGVLGKMTRQGEEAIGKLAQDLLENPMVSGALSAALGTRERANRAQAAALSALNLPSGSDLERLTRRLRSVSQRLEGVEDALDRVERRVADLDEAPVEQRLAAIEGALERIEAALAVQAGASESG